jgi:predicted transcriptional regulator
MTTTSDRVLNWLSTKAARDTWYPTRIVSKLSGVSPVATRNSLFALEGLGIVESILAKLRPGKGRACKLFRLKRKES